MTRKEANNASRQIDALGFRTEVMKTDPREAGSHIITVWQAHGNLVTEIWDQNDVDSFVQGCKS